MIVIDGVEMLDVHEAARVAQRSPETVRRWVWSGRLTSVKQGNKLFVPRTDVPEARTGDAVHPDLSLRDWAARLAARGPGEPGGSASDLIFEDREERAGR